MASCITTSAARIVMPAYFQAQFRGRSQTGSSRITPWVRNSVGFDWHRDKQLGSPIMDATGLGDESPNDTRTCHAQGQHFGYPIATRATRSTPSSARTRLQGVQAADAEARSAYRAHRACASHRKMFPAEYQNNIFIAMRGS